VKIPGGGNCPIAPPLVAGLMVATKYLRLQLYTTDQHKIWKKAIASSTTTQEHLSEVSYWAAEISKSCFYARNEKWHQRCRKETLTLKRMVNCFL